MALEEKYKALIDAAHTAGVANLAVREQDGVLYIDGDAPSGAVKDQLWSIYDQIDPNYTSGDLILNVNAKAEAGSKVRVATQETALNIRKGPGTDQPIVGKAQKDEIITLISQANDQWSSVRTDDGTEGYAYSQYLEPVA
ncbi:MAG: SH3 domain-containing protein [Niabella sp.]|uniref:SH3 domain-containing protein n=1 Tax=Niabella sp. TaxID=1962976 RepID=UPI001B12F854|nr:SH3 domain-containing protein [Niabella sp.]MBO9595490.1 SH3 domain-containing protein [Niabella sp.]